MRAFRVQAGRPAFNIHDLGVTGTPHGAEAKIIINEIS